MQMKTKKVDNVNVIYPPNQLDINVTFELKAIIDDIIENDPDTHILLNLQNVEYINSSSLGEILRVIKIFKGTNRLIKMCSVFKNVKEIINIVNLSNVIDIYESENEALESFQAE